MLSSAVSSNGNRLYVLATGPNRFGVLTVSAAARPWEKLPPPVKVSWFPSGKRLQAVVKPAPGTVIEPSTPIQVTFSEPGAAVPGRVRPTIVRGQRQHRTQSRQAGPAEAGIRSWCSAPFRFR